MRRPSSAKLKTTEEKLFSTGVEAVTSKGEGVKDEKVVGVTMHNC